MPTRTAFLLMQLVLFTSCRQDASPDDGTAGQAGTSSAGGSALGDAAAGGAAGVASSTSSERGGSVADDVSGGDNSGGVTGDTERGGQSGAPNNVAAGGGAGEQGSSGASGTGAANGGDAGEGGAGAASSGGSAGLADTDPNGGAGNAETLPAADAPPQISGLIVEPNPNNAISCYVSWATDQPANAVVQFGQGEVEFEIRSDEAATEHRVLVIGMHEEKEYVIRALSSNSEGTDQAEDSFTTGALPSGIPSVQLTANEPSSSQSGWTLTNIMVGSEGSFGSSSPAIIVMYDELGVPVWYYVNGDSSDSRGDVSADLLPNGNVLIGPAPGEPPREVDLGGNIVWEGLANSGGGSGAMTHHASFVSNGNYIVIRDTSNGNLQANAMEEYTPSNELVWEWDLLDHITPPAGASGDWCHANSIAVDLEADSVYLNCRYLGLFKIQRSSKDILWLMGGTQTPDVVGDFSYPEAGSQYNDTHDPEFNGNTILFYDNGGFAGLGPGADTADFHSRVVEYEIDEAAATATLVWEFPGDFPVDDWYKQDWYAAYWGDADRLANDNILIAIGLKAADLQSRIVEVTRDGQVVWEITFPANQGLYRAERLSPPPLVRPLSP